MVFSVINFQIYNIIVSKWKHGIVPIDIIIFSEELEFLSTSVIETINIDESSHENTIVIFIIKKELKNTYYNHVTEDDNGNSFELFYYENSIYNYSNIFMVSWWVIDSYLNIENFKFVILKI